MIDDAAENGGFSLFQIALNVSDLAASLRFFSETFGFANGGAQAGWGDGMRLQGLSPAGQTLLWWLVAGGRRTQVELFHHTGPTQRPQPADWSPVDHGWVRLGIAVTKFDQVIERLKAQDIPIMGLTADDGGNRRAAFRDRFSGIIIEVLEDAPGLIGYPRERVHGIDPVLLYATSSVGNLEDARTFYGDIIGLPLLPLEHLHSASHENLWGLSDSRRSGFVAQVGDGFLEIVQYAYPSGKPRRHDYCCSDQGMMNVGLFTRETQTLQCVIDALDAEGRPPHSLNIGPGILGTYILDQGREVELFSCPPEVEPMIGLNPAMPFLAVEPEQTDASTGIKIIQRFE